MNNQAECAGVKRQQQSLENNPELLQMLASKIYENVFVGIYICTLCEKNEPSSLKIISANLSSESVLGVPVSVAKDKLFCDVFPELYPQMLPFIEKDLFINGLGKRFEIITEQDNSNVQKAFSFDVFTLQEDTYGICINEITKRKNAEKALKLREEMYRSIVEHSSEAIFCADPQGEILFISNAVEKFGYLPENVMGKNMMDFIFEEDKEKVHLAFENICEKKESKSFEFRIIDSNGNIRIIEESSSFIRNSEGNIIFITGILRDVTEQQTFNKLLTESEHKYRMLVNNIQSAVIKVDNWGGEYFFNEYAKDLLTGQVVSISKKLQDANIQNFSDLKENLSIFWDRQTIVSDDAQNQKALQSIMKDGKSIWLDWHSKSILDASGNCCGFIAIGTDISARIEMENSLNESRIAAEKANRAKSEFLANMSHEIRTPLNGIIGFSDILVSKEQDASKKEMLELILSSGRNLLSIINDILDLSRIESGKTVVVNKPIALNVTLNAIFKMFQGQAYEKQIEFLMYTDEEIPENCMGDELKLKQILINLIGNALKFTPAKGKIMVNVTLDFKKNQMAYVRFEVKDTGIGIPADKLGSIFERFFQVDTSSTKKHGGTGLGLAIVKRMVDMMHGSVEVRSKVGEGTSFIFVLPFSFEAAETEKKMQSQSQSQMPENMDILIADDMEMNQILLKKVLEPKGYKLTFVGNGLEVLSKAIAHSYDLILMDIQMPYIDGLQATRELRAAGYKNKIIAVTAFAMKNDLEDCFEAGMDDFLSKPLDFKELFRLIQKHFMTN